MSRTLVRASLRHLLAHPGQTALALVGIALGVAAVLSIDLANESARRAFEAATDAVAGRATHHVVGGPSGLPDDVYRAVRIDLGIRAAAPILERDVAVPDVPGYSLRLLGVDAFAEHDVRGDLRVEGGGDVSFAALVTEPGTALLAREAADELGVQPGGRVVVRVATTRHRLAVLGVLPRRVGTGNLLVVDVATAQEILGAVGRLDRIDLVLPDGDAGVSIVERIRARLPAGADVVPAGARAHALVEATRAFRVNLTAMSLLALFVGGFLVYNTMLFSVVQRRPLIGTLRALGVTRREIFVLVLGEAAAVGSVATLLGLPIGVLLAHGMVHLVTRTINDLYFVVTVRDVAIVPLALAKAVALGLGGTVLAALAPAIEAASTAPRTALARETLELRARRAVPALALGGLGLIVLGSAVIHIAGRGLGASYAGLFIIFLGMALLVPVVGLGLVRVLEWPLAALLGPVGRLAARGISASLSRTGVAMAALAIAVAATVGVTLMIGSFRSTVARWLETSVQADVYVSPPSLVGNRPDATLPRDLVERLRGVSGVAAIGTSRVLRTDVDGVPVTLVAIDPPRAGAGAFRFKDGGGQAWEAWQRGAVFVSEPFAYRRGRAVGDHVRVRSDAGDVELPIAAIVHDYGSSEGVVLMSRATYGRLWRDHGVSSAAVYAGQGVDVDALVRTLRTAAGDDEVLIRPSRRLREDSLAVFDRTFAVTGVLRLLVVTVAFVGVLAALMAVELDRARELAVLRAQGLTPRDVWWLVATETGLLGLVAGLAAIPVGIALSALLVFVINQRAFGWTLEFSLTAAPLLQAVGLALAAAALAGVYPAWRLARAPLAEALREE
ncbi:MAG: ABC transporter permease [Candidatus Rokubacteria bacterium]|nr:ABC transporter permease [Candidatus Rokubacteria bacterium]